MKTICILILTLLCVGCVTFSGTEKTSFRPDYIEPGQGGGRGGK